jgi:galactose mutarotase-like enzyme
MHTYAIEHGSTDEIPTITLVSRASKFEAAFAPGAGMVGCSLRHRGEELLATPGGLAHYARERGTIGIPLLHPWANRLSEFSFQLAGHQLRLDADSPLVQLDPNGLPIHGLLAAWPNWEVSSQAAGAQASLVARFDFAAYPELMSAFPFQHELEIRASVQNSTLMHATTIRATAARAYRFRLGITLTSVYRGSPRLSGGSRPRSAAISSPISG